MTSVHIWCRQPRSRKVATLFSSRQVVEIFDDFFNATQLYTLIYPSERIRSSFDPYICTRIWPNTSKIVHNVTVKQPRVYFGFLSLTDPLEGGTTKT